MAMKHHWLNELDNNNPPSITPEVLRVSMPYCRRIDDWVHLLNLHTNRYDFDKTETLAIFLAQIGHESGDLNRMSESLNYSTGALRVLFGPHRITPEEIEAYGRKEGQEANEPMLADCLYGGEWGYHNLGNIEPGDGWRFRGSGLIQLTGRANFEACSYDTGLPLLDYPELLREDMSIALQSSLWFWETRVTGSTLKSTTRQINGGFNGIEDRDARYQRTLKALQEIV